MIAFSTSRRNASLEREKWKNDLALEREKWQSDRDLEHEKLKAEDDRRWLAERRRIYASLLGEVHELQRNLKDVFQALFNERAGWADPTDGPKLASRAEFRRMLEEVRLMGSPDVARAVSEVDRAIYDSQALRDLVRYDDELGPRISRTGEAIAIAVVDLRNAARKDLGLEPDELDTVTGNTGPDEVGHW